MLLWAPCGTPPSVPGMSLLSLAGAPDSAPSLGRLVDGLAARTGGWVVVERHGRVLAHGVGAATCPPSLATALLAKDLTPARTATRWQRGSGGGRAAGALDGSAVAVAELGDGAAAWLVGAAAPRGTAATLALDEVVGALADALALLDGPVHDGLLLDVLHGRPGATQAVEAVPALAPAALLVLRPTCTPGGVLARHLAGLTAGTPTRVHALPDEVIVLAGEPEVAPLVEAVLAAHPDVLAGAAPLGSDGPLAHRVAGACATAAGQLGRRLARADDPRVHTELVVQEAGAAVAGLGGRLPDGPLQRLAAHDARHQSDLLPSLRAWVRAGQDVGAAATRLHVHTNTLRYRLRRATEVTGLDLSCPRQLLALQLQLLDGV